MMTPSYLAGGEFDDDQFDHAYPVGIENNYWNLARNWILQRELSRVQRGNLLGPSARILDIGCGRGIVVQHLVACGWDAWGVEVGTPMPVDNLDGRVFTGTTAQSLPEPFRRSVRCLLLLDVIEHIADAPAFLRDIGAAFPNATLSLVMVPARPEAWSNYDDYYSHFRRYTPDLLARHLTEAGLTPTGIRHFFHSLYFAAMAIKLSGRRREVIRSAPIYPRLHRFIARYLAAESGLLQLFPRLPGLSLFALATPGNAGERSHTMVTDG